MIKNRALFAVLALVSSLAVAVPVSAQPSLRGPMESHFNLGFGDASSPCSQFTWVGTVDLAGETFDMAFIPTGVVAVGRTLHFQEAWLIYDVADFQFTDGVLTVCDGHVAMSGADAGIVAPNGKASANGRVEFVDPAGPFDPTLADRPVRWSGVVAESLVDFTGKFAIQ